MKTQLYELIEMSSFCKKGMISLRYNNSPTRVQFKVRFNKKIGEIEGTRMK